jgi:hypothetical protein
MLYIIYVLEYFSGKNASLAAESMYGTKVSMILKFLIDKYLTRCKNMNIKAVKLISIGARGGAIVRGTALQALKSRVRFPIVSLEFFIDIILPIALWPCRRLSL